MIRIYYLYRLTNSITNGLKLIVNFSSTGRPKSVDCFSTFEFLFKKHLAVDSINFRQTILGIHLAYSLCQISPPDWRAILDKILKNIVDIVNPLRWFI
jgi:hypothetical protein